MAKSDPTEVLLKGVRLSYTHVYQPQEQENDDGSKRYTYSTVCIIPKDDEDQIFAVEDAIDAAKAAKWGDKKNWPKLKADRICLKDGDEEDKDEYLDAMIIRGSAPESSPPQVIKNVRDEDGNWEASRPGGPRSIYSGCYANVLLRLWAQDNKYGKRVNASLEVVQFAKKGEAFGRGPVDPNDKFGKELEDTGGEYGDDEDEDERPSRGRSSRRGRDDDDEDERPARRSSRRGRDDDDEDERPSRSSRRGRDDDDEDERPARRSSRRGRDDDEDEDERPSRGRSSRRGRDDDEDEDERPSRGRSSRRGRDDDDDEDERPSRGRRSRGRDDDDDDDERPRRRSSRL